MFASSWLRQLQRRWFGRRAIRPVPVRRVRPRLEVLENRTLLSASAYVVTSAADSNAAGTLLYAINQVNAGNYNEIDFNIGSVGSAQTINLGTQLPTLTASGVYINGLSQGGTGNTTPLITLSGSGEPIHIDGLLVQGSNCTISGLTVSNFGANGIEVAGSNNLIGGATAGAANIITGNVGDGIKIDSGASGNQVVGDYIGTNAAGNGGLGNGNGVEIVSSDNTVGGLTATAGNTISGNNNDGILIDARASGIQVLGNYIGTNFAGTAALANSGNGVEIFGSGNTVGGANPAAFNLISGNGKDGVLINSSGSENQVLGNYIGTNADGTASVANNVGIEVVGIGNMIGGTVSGASNLISGNKGDGVLIDGTASGTQVLGNYIGTNFAGTGPVGNSIGIEIAGISNTVGGTAAGARNIISGNGNDGVLIDSTANGNQLMGNYIGTNANGLAAVANSGNGIEVAGNNNEIGYPNPSGGGPADEGLNIISGNSKDGVLIDSGGTGNEVTHNYIGINVAGTGSLANSSNGIEVAGNHSTITEENVISGNSNDGVLIDSTSSGDQVFANLIGTDSYGYGTPVANSGNGIEVAGNNNTIYGGNVISGNSKDGVLIARGASGNQVLGNDIGADVGGISPVANSGNGIEVAGNNNTIGGGNVISGNSKDGVLIASGASGNQVLGSQIGANGSGTGVEVGGNSNTVGGTASGAGNAISGNSNAGVLISGGANQVLGNSILSNGTGIVLSGSSNTIGGTASGAGNLISGNSKDGVLIDSGASDNEVLGNYIGTNAAGTAALANSIGVEVDGASNTVGGAASGASNLISGDNYAGLVISGNANQVLGNYIGVARGGTSALADGTGIYVKNGNSNTIGGTVSGAGNLISGNSTDGILIFGGNDNQFLGNYIGTTADGSAPLANHHSGIYLPNGSGNIIGGTASGAGNLISGNSNVGVWLDVAADGTQVLGNTVGLNAAGTAAVANGTGIEVGRSDNTVGGTASGARNIISGNSGAGLVLSTTAEGSGGDLVLGNYIGTDTLGGVALPNSIGIVVASSDNTIGGTASGAGNLISGNSHDGVLISSPFYTATGNVVLGNSIGTTAGGIGGLANSGNGIEVADNDNTIGGGNLIAGNSNDGVKIDSSASGTQVLGNTIRQRYLCCS
jgi:hypothetical protein